MSKPGKNSCMGVSARFFSLWVAISAVFRCSQASESCSGLLVVEAWPGFAALTIAACITQAPAEAVAWRCRATSSALVGRPRFGFASSFVGRTAVWAVTPRTCRASQLYTSSMRHSSRLVPGRRQMGGRDFWLRVASLRMLATDLCRHCASWSTVKRTAVFAPTGVCVIFDNPVERLRSSSSCAGRLLGD